MTGTHVTGTHVTAPIGLVGYGFGGRYFHAPMLTAGPDIEFVGVVTTDPARRRLVAAEHPGVRCLDDLTALVEAGAQAVAISTPASTHVDLTLQALDLGLHVICDKPFALSVTDARRVAERAAAVDRLAVPFQNRRWDSDALTLRRVLDEGLVGEAVRLESRFERFDSAATVPAAGGGILYDFGSHLVDQALWLFGPVASVYAETGPPGHGPAGEHRFFAALRHTSGMVTHLAGDWVQGAPADRFRLTGSAGSYVVREMDGQEAALIAGGRPGESSWGVEPPEAWGWLQRGEERTPVPSEPGRWDLLYAEFAAAVLGQGPPPVRTAEAIAALTVLEACEASARTGDSVAIPTD